MARRALERIDNGRIIGLVVVVVLALFGVATTPLWRYSMLSIVPSAAAPLLASALLLIRSYLQSSVRLSLVAAAVATLYAVLVFLEPGGGLLVVVFGVLAAAGIFIAGRQVGLFDT